MPINMPYYVASTLTEATLLGDEKFKTLNDCIKEVAEWYRSLPE
jgi:hypothetical protein